MSGIVQKVKDTVLGTSHTDNTNTTHNSATGLTGPSHTGQHQTRDTAGPHRSDVANKVDPRVDSDRDGRGALGNTGTNPLGSNTGAGGFGSKQATNYGPHGTVGNKLDPTVNDHGNTHRATGGGAYNTGPHDSNLANKLDPTVGQTHNTSSGLGGLTGTHNTTAGPHQSNLANKADPRVDSDRDGHSGLGNTHNTHTTGAGLGGIGHNTHNTTAGPHQSNLANKADPRVDSDRDGHSGLGNTHNTHSTGAGLGGLTGTHNTNNHGAGYSGLGGNNTHNATTTAGPHDSNLANKLDPRVDSDRSKQTGITHAGEGQHHAGSGVVGQYDNTSYASNPHSNAPGHVVGHYDQNTLKGNTTAGPHDSNLANKLDPRVDSDRSNQHNVGGVHAIGVPGSHSNEHSGLMSSTDHRAAPHTTLNAGNTHNTHGGLGHNTTAGPHSSNLANKADPRVDSDRDGRAGLGNTHNTHNTHGSALGSGVGTTAGGLGHTTHNTTAGPHQSNLANKADPRVDSDRDGRAGLGNTHNTHATGTHGSHGTTGLTGAHSSTHNTGPAPNTAGPHKSDLLNKLDPRVDSNLDGSKTFGGDKTFASPGAHHE